jgi:hypothetical protein
MDQSYGCACRQGGSPSPGDVGPKARPLALMPEDRVETAAGRSPLGLLILQQFGIDASPRTAGDSNLVVETPSVTGQAQNRSMLPRQEATLP